MYEQFGYPGLFAAYNAGPGRYAQHLAGRRALPDETVRYLASVAPPTRVPAAAVAVAPPPMSLFAVRRDAAPAGSENPRSPLSSLFVSLSPGTRCDRVRHREGGSSSRSSPRDGWRGPSDEGRGGNE